MHAVRQLAEAGRQLQHVAPNGSLHTRVISQQALELTNITIGSFLGVQVRGLRCVDSR